MTTLRPLVVQELLEKCRSMKVGNIGGRSSKMKYKIALIQSEEGYSASVPGLPGCWSQGATEEEALTNIGEAIQEYIQVVADQIGDAEIREIDVAV